MNSDKEYLFELLMNDVKDCDLCCKEGGGIKPRKLLKNFIADRPDSPRYGGCPNLWIDWANRLESKIAVIGQDWGCEEGPASISLLRQQYEDCVRRSGNPDKIWRLKREPIIEDKATPMMAKYFKLSSIIEGLPKLPDKFLDNLFLTNAILCVRKGTIYSGSDTIDAKKSIENCQMFLRMQLKIVRPLVVVTLGKYPLMSLGQIKENQKLTSRIEEVQAEYPGYIKTNIHDLPISIVPVFHPSWPQNRNPKQQIEDYRYLWRALSDSTKLFGDDLLNYCFPNNGN